MSELKTTLKGVPTPTPEGLDPPPSKRRPPRQEATEPTPDSAVIGKTLPAAPRVPQIQGDASLLQGATFPGSTTISSRPPPGFEPMGDLIARVDPLIGLVIAERYRIVEPLGRGGMGIVYKVEHKSIGKLLAMKLLAGELSQNPEVVKRFKHEALTVSKLSSPNTVQVFDYGVSDGLTYLVMELVTGGDLGKILRSREALSAVELGRIVIQVCNSLSEAHQKGIVHRDIKPENIMIARARDDTDFAKVLDFGLAKIREGSELNELTSAGAIVGTPYFMSPEQVRGEEVDPRSDVYSLGAVMYRALTGQYAFNGPTPMAVFAKHLTENAVPPIERAPDRGIPQGISDIVMRALQKDPADRFQRIDDLQSAIVDELADLGTSGIESLLDSSALKRLGGAQTAVVEGVDPGPAPVATRDELEAYERKLRNRRWITYALFLSVVGAAVVAAVHAYQRYREHAGRFSGHEVEPNDTPAEANAVPFGSAVNGMIGKRLTPTQADLDIFAIEVPKTSDGALDAPNEVSLSLTPLPNMALCAQIFRKGEATPLATFCPGRPAFALNVPRFRLDPGSYLVGVTEDMNPYDDEVRYLFENVSDEYSLTMASASADASTELEPNDALGAANPIEPGKTIEGTIGWVGDKDFYCGAHLEAGKKYRFSIADSGRSERDGVLAVAPYKDGAQGAMVRVHAGTHPKMSAPPFIETDKVSPFNGIEIAGSGGGGCVVVFESVDPFEGKAGSVPRGSPAKYRVTLEEAP